MVCAYGMAEATLAVSFHPWGTPLKVDTVLAKELEHDQRAVPADEARRPVIRRRRPEALTPELPDAGAAAWAGSRWPSSVRVARQLAER